MGLTVRAKGLTDRTGFDCGYITFGVYRQEVAKAYDVELGQIYEKWCKSALFGEKLTEAEISRWDEISNEGLNTFLCHSDCDGKFTPQECRKIYNAMEDIKVDMQGHNYGIMEPYNMHEHWLNMFKHCADKRVNMYFC